MAPALSRCYFSHDEVSHDRRFSKQLIEKFLIIISLTSYARKGVGEPMVKCLLYPVSGAPVSPLGFKTTLTFKNRKQLGFRSRSSPCIVAYRLVKTSVRTTFLAHRHHDTRRRRPRMICSGRGHRRAIGVRVNVIKSPWVFFWPVGWLLAVVLIERVRGN